MNSIKDNLLRVIHPITSRIPINPLIRLTGQKLIFPFYHAISNGNLVHIKHLYPVRSENMFRKDLNFFLKYYNPIDLDELITLVDGKKKLKHNSFFLTFDDGLKEVYEVVAPLLKEKGIPAAFFLNTDFVDNKNLFYRYKASLLLEALATKRQSEATIQKMKSFFSNKKSADIKELILSVTYSNKNILDQLADLLEVDFKNFLENEKPYMSKEQIKELINKGFTVGAHSIDHPEYQSIPLDEQISQTKKSMEFIVDEFKITHKVFSFPFTDYGVSKKFFDIIFSQDNKVADLTFGTAGIKKDSVTRNIQRIPMENIQLSAHSIITMQYLYYLCKFPFGKNTIRRQ